jgi:hypothetical protein
VRHSLPASPAAQPALTDPAVRPASVRWAIHKFVLGLTTLGVTMLFANVLTCGLGAVPRARIGLVKASSGCASRTRISIKRTSWRRRGAVGLSRQGVNQGDLAEVLCAYACLIGRGLDALKQGGSPGVAVDFLFDLFELLGVQE